MRHLEAIMIVFIYVLFSVFVTRLIVLNQSLSNIEYIEVAKALAYLLLVDSNSNPRENLIKLLSDNPYVVFLAVNDTVLLDKNCSFRSINFVWFTVNGSAYVVRVGVKH